MNTTFSELVITGNFTLVKGFLMGFLCARNVDAKYFFHHKSGSIRRDTFTGLIRQLLEFESDVYMCLETSEVQDFKAAVEKAYPKIGLTIKQIREIKDAEFDCELEIFNEEDGRMCRNIFEKARENVNLDNFKEEEIFDKMAANSPLHRAHAYTYMGKGKVRGDFENVVETFLRLKRSPFSDFVKCDEVILNFK